MVPFTVCLRLAKGFSVVWQTITEGATYSCKKSVVGISKPETTSILNSTKLSRLGAPTKTFFHEADDCVVKQATVQVVTVTVTKGSPQPSHYRCPAKDVRCAAAGGMSSSRQDWSIAFQSNHSEEQSLCLGFIFFIIFFFFGYTRCTIYPNNSCFLEVLPAVATSVEYVLARNKEFEGKSYFLKVNIVSRCNLFDQPMMVLFPP